MNRLAQETSPYLKQHAENPVDWFPWGSEALEKSKKEDKPILLSVGYSACHWCHVMAHESFENPQIAQIMNDHFVNIKVDREERPDLDQIYQVVAQMMTRGGGWPLTVFLTPDLKPFYGGTYFPPSDRYGRPGFAKILLALAKGYREDRGEILDRAEKMTRVIQTHGDGNENEIDANDKSSLVDIGSFTEASKAWHETLLASARSLLSHIDWQNGGIGSAPKFPNAMTFTFLWRMSQCSFVPASDRESLREAVLLSLEKMAKGGIFDQLGGGFHRYSVDEHWAVPHFEKMLYDNGLLLKLYSEVLLQAEHSSLPLKSSLKNLLLETIEKTVQYVAREMVSPHGLFYAAQDADSPSAPGAHAEEGMFFIWTGAQLAPLLTAEELELFCTFYGVTEAGNFENGETVLFQAGEKENLTTIQKQWLRSAEQKVLSARDTRIRPGLDDKSLVSWNALMISGLVWASLALETTEPTKSSATLAKKLSLHAEQALQKYAFDPQARLFSTIQKNNKNSTSASLAGNTENVQGKFSGYLDDYTFLAQAQLDLTRIDAQNAEARFWSAQTLMQKVITHFRKDGENGFYFTANDHEFLIHRPKSFYDQAIPSGTGVAFGVLSVLAAATAGSAEFQKILDQDWPQIAPQLEKNSFGLGELLAALLLQAVGPVIIKGETPKMWQISPFTYTESATFKNASHAHTQFCHRQVCVLDHFQLP